MKILHQTGFRPNWNLDSYFQNEIGDGFIFCAFNMESDKFGQSISNYESDEYQELSMIDLQFYGNKESKNLGKLKSYPFHPANSKKSEQTEVDGLSRIMQGITFQEKRKMKNIIIPNYYFDYKRINSLLSMVKNINRSVRKKANTKYYMTIPFNNITLLDDAQLEKILFLLTDMNIQFDGYYIVCESNPGYKKKISDDLEYYQNVSRILKLLAKQGFSVIYGYANFDALVFSTSTLIDYMTIGTFENLRNFSISRYTNEMQGGPSEGWYFSEKLLNFIKAKHLKQIRKAGALELIKNEKNIFSDIITDPGYIWNANKVDVHKNYLLSISRLFSKMVTMRENDQRRRFLLDKVIKARQIYKELADKEIFLIDESSDYHLSAWYSFLMKSSQ